VRVFPAPRRRPRPSRDASLPPVRPPPRVPSSLTFSTAPSRARLALPDVLTAVANAALLRDEACSHPLPRRVAEIPDLHDRLLRKRKEAHESALGRLRDANDEANGSPESASLVVLLEALEDATNVTKALEAVLRNRSLSESERRARLSSGTENESTYPSESDDTRNALFDASLEEPAFECVSAPDLLRRLRAVLDAYADDVQVKRAAFAAVAAGARRSPRKSGDAAGAASRGQDRSENTEVKGFDPSRETMTVCLATWILSPSIDEAVRDELDAVIARETK